jgi:hypothetical protein
MLLPDRCELPHPVRQINRTGYRTQIDPAAVHAQCHPARAGRNEECRPLGDFLTLAVASDACFLREPRCRLIGCHNGNAASRTRAMAQGAAGYLLKPFSAADLLDALNSALEPR